MPGPPSGRGFGTPAVKSVYLNPFSTESVQGRHRRHLLPHLSCRFGNECQTTYIMMIPAPRKVSARRRQHGQRSSRRATHLPRIGAGKQKTTPRKKKPRTRGSSHGEITSAAKIQSRANTRENSHQLLRLGIQASGLIPFHDADSCNFWCPFFRAFTRSSMESSKTNIRLGLTIKYKAIVLLPRRIMQQQHGPRHQNFMTVGAEVQRLP